MKAAESRSLQHSMQIDVVVLACSGTPDEGISERSGHGCRGAERQDDQH